MRKKMAFLFPHKRAFTLVEVLVVVLVAVLVTMMAVPAYKKTRDKSRYMAASGVLMELGNAMRMLREEYPTLNVSATLGATSTTGLSETALNSAPTSANLITWLQVNRYLNRLPLDANGKYMGYSFKVASSGVSCPCGPNTVKASPANNPLIACMYTDSTSMKEYYCKVVYAVTE